MTKYEKDRNSVIDDAESHANKLFGTLKTRKEKDLDKWKRSWDRFYLAEVDRLYKEKFGRK